MVRDKKKYTSKLETFLGATETKINVTIWERVANNEPPSETEPEKKTTIQPWFNQNSFLGLGE